MHTKEWILYMNNETRENNTKRRKPNTSSNIQYTVYQVRGNVYVSSIVTKIDNQIWSLWIPNEKLIKIRLLVSEKFREWVFLNYLFHFRSNIWIRCRLKVSNLLAIIFMPVFLSNKTASTSGEHWRMSDSLLIFTLWLMSF